MSLHDAPGSREWLPSDNAIPDDQVAIAARAAAMRKAERAMQAYRDMQNAADFGCYADSELIRPAPRVSRDTEPCPLWVFVAIFGIAGALSVLLILGCISGFENVVSFLLRYGDALLTELARWIAGVM